MLRRELRNEGELRCKRCLAWQPEENFRLISRQRKDGTTWTYRAYRCRKCCSEVAGPQVRQWRSLEPNRLRINELNTQRRKRIREEAISAYGGKCVCCGERRHEFLTFDHKNGRGPVKKMQIHLELERLQRAGWPTENHQLLCFNCNGAKGVYGSCPHTWSVNEHRAPLSVEARQKLYFVESQTSGENGQQNT
jgi:5-methylcytosine-specific restriction endonuclease McrA